ncbi:MAG TPA: S41 family peptidase [Dongiaceae bacterium]|nr:S41 family peptidase [Dongiaceae bacterium]
MGSRFPSAWRHRVLLPLLAPLVLMPAILAPVALAEDKPAQQPAKPVAPAAAPATPAIPGAVVPPPQPGLLPLNELRTFADVFDRIKQAYVEDVDDKTLLENAIKGMLTELDPHSAYLEPEAYQDLQISTTGEFGGLGIEVGMEDGFVKVITPIDDTPAQKAGVLPGDLIIKLDETPVKGLSLNDAVKLMRGKAGSVLKLTIIRQGSEKPLEINVTRAVIQVQSVKQRLLEKDYGYVRLSQFQVHTGGDMLKSLERLKAENKAQLRGLVLDLRNNPGGVLQAAVDVADAFINDGLVVYTKGRLPDSDMQFSATPGDNLVGVPIVVLINGGSASASEIVAGALQDHKRAVIMGTTSFGKGSVQTVLPLHNNRALKLTTARYYTPGGRSIQAEGIVPDIQVDNAHFTTVEEGGQIKEKDLTGHLSNPVNGVKDKAKTPDEGKGKKGKDDKAAPPSTNPALTAPPEKLVESDYQLYEALNLLKALNVLSKTQTVQR